MRSTGIVLALGVVACGPRAPAAATGVPAGPSRDARAGARQAALERVLAAARRDGFGGTVLVGDADTVLFERSVGLADRARGRPHAPDEVWRWASITKQVTAVLVLQQVDAGRLSLDATIAEVLPDFRGPAAGKTTVRQLLAHTAGLPNPGDSPAAADDVPAFYRTPPPRGRSVHAAAADGYCAGPAKHEPGVRFEYNNCDYLVLGAMLERVTGLSYATLVDRQLARPLGSPGLRVRSPGEPADPVVGYLAAGEREPAQDIGTYGAAGALHGSARALLAFDRALLRGELVSAAAREQMWAGDPALGYVALGVWSYPAQLAGCTKSVHLIERRGAIGGVQVRNVLVPDPGIILIAFTNTASVEFGEVWQGKGLTHDLLSAALCPVTP